MTAANDDRRSRPTARRQQRRALPRHTIPPRHDPRTRHHPSRRSLAALKTATTSHGIHGIDRPAQPHHHRLPPPDRLTTCPTSGPTPWLLQCRRGGHEQLTVASDAGRTGAAAQSGPAPARLTPRRVIGAVWRADVSVPRVLKSRPMASRAGFHSERTRGRIWPAEREGPSRLV